jgi:hypothetical protein
VHVVQDTKSIEGAKMVARQVHLLISQHPWHPYRNVRHFN